MTKRGIVVGIILGILVVVAWWWQNRGTNPLVRQQAERVTPSEAPSPTPFEPLEACDLVTKTELETIVGEPLSEPKQSFLASQSGILQQSCLYLAASGDFTPSVQVDLWLPLPEDPTSLTTYWDNLQQQQQSYPRYQSAPDIGGEAYFGSLGLHILNNETAVTVIVSLKDVTKNRPMAQKIAEMAMDRLASLSPALPKP